MLFAAGTPAHAGVYYVNPGCGEGTVGAGGGGQTAINGKQATTSSRYARNIGCGGSWNIFDGPNVGHSVFANGSTWPGVGVEDRTAGWTFVGPNDPFHKAHGGVFTAQQLADAGFGPSDARITALFSGAVQNRLDTAYQIVGVNNPAHAASFIWGCTVGLNPALNSISGWSAPDCGSTAYTGQGSETWGGIPGSPTSVGFFAQCPGANCNHSFGRSYLSVGQQFYVQVTETSDPQVTSLTLPNNAGNWINAATSNTLGYQVSANDLMGIANARITVNGTIVATPDTPCGNHNGGWISTYAPCITGSNNAISNAQRSVAYSGSISAAALGDGVHTGQLFVYDGIYPGGDCGSAGCNNTSSENRYENTFQIRVDRTQPTGTAPAASNPAGVKTVQFTGITDATSGVNTGGFTNAQYSTDNGATWQNLSATSFSGTTYTGTMSGALNGRTYPVRLTIRDNAGNTRTVTGNVTLASNGEPSTAIACTPAGTWINTNASCQVTGTAPDGFLRNTTGIDAAPSVNTTSNPATVLVTSEGVHTVNATTTDTDGDTGPQASAIVRIDKTPPTGTAPTTIGATCTVTWTDVADQAGLSGIDPSSFTATYRRAGTGTYQPLSAGSYNAAGETYAASVPSSECVPGRSYDVQITYTDLAGNTRTIPAATVTRSSNGAPSTTVNCATGWVNADPATCVITGTAPDGFLENRYEIDTGSTQNTATNPANADVSGEGVHTVTARTVDVNDQVGADATGTVRIDTTPPNASWGTGSTTTTRTITVTAIADPACPGSADCSGLDTTISTTGFALEFSTDNGVTWTAAGDPTWNAGSQTFTGTVPADGVYDVRFVAHDTATNTRTLTKQIVVDADPPSQLTLACDPGAPAKTCTWHNDTQRTFTFTYQGTNTGPTQVAAVHYRICEQANPGTCPVNDHATATTDASGTITFDITTLIPTGPEGQWQITAWLEDGAGNTGTPSTPVALSFDQTAPTVTVPAQPVNPPALTVTLADSVTSGPGPASGLDGECQIEARPQPAGSWVSYGGERTGTTCTSTTGNPGSQAPGTYDVRVTTIDVAGNERVHTEPGAFTNDSTVTFGDHGTCTENLPTPYDFGTVVPTQTTNSDTFRQCVTANAPITVTAHGNPSAQISTGAHDIPWSAVTIQTLSAPGTTSCTTANTCALNSTRTLFSGGGPTPGTVGFDFRYQLTPPGGQPAGTYSTGGEVIFTAIS